MLNAVQKQSNLGPKKAIISRTKTGHLLLHRPLLPLLFPMSTQSNAIKVDQIGSILFIKSFLIISYQYLPPCLSLSLPGFCILIFSPSLYSPVLTGKKKTLWNLNILFPFWLKSSAHSKTRNLKNISCIHRLFLLSPFPVIHSLPITIPDPGKTFLLFPN